MADKREDKGKKEKEEIKEVEDEGPEIDIDDELLRAGREMDKVRPVPISHA
jgi:hypothetical protein